MPTTRERSPRLALPDVFGLQDHKDAHGKVGPLAEVAFRVESIHTTHGARHAHARGPFGRAGGSLAIMKLYMVVRCPFAHRASMALGEKGLSFEPVFYAPRTRPTELDAVSKNAKSPTLFDGDDAVYESAVVLEYLEDKFPGRPLLPGAAKARADVRVTIARVNEELGSKFSAVMGEALTRLSPFETGVAVARPPASAQFWAVRTVLASVRNR